MHENELAKTAFEYALKVHKSLGPGLLESAYKECLYFELLTSGLFVEREKAIPLVYEDVRMECGYRADIIVENKFLIETKSVETLTDIHLAQVLTYLNLSKIRLGLLINFNLVLLKDGVKRIINGQL